MRLRDRSALILPGINTRYRITLRGKVVCECNDWHTASWAARTAARMDYRARQKQARSDCFVLACDITGSRWPSVSEVAA